MREFVTLQQLLESVKIVLEDNFCDTYWVVADVSDLRENVRGHCYLELVQKDDSSKLMEAKVRAVIWANHYVRLKSSFFQATGQMLSTGMKVLACVSLSFHELYGLSLEIVDLDPSYTIGDMQRKRQETISRLKEDGVWDMNRQLELPFLLQRLAVISSETAAGYGDFCDQLLNNNRSFVYSVELFPAIMQGDSAAESVIAALDRIYEKMDDFDAVVIIRGGGASTDLLAFDDYHLSASVAQFPLPVITGIGHERDESVVDMVAHTRCKTPTAVAAFIFNQTFIQEKMLLERESAIKAQFLNRLEREKQYLDEASKNLVRYCSHNLAMEEQKVVQLHKNLSSAFHHTLQNRLHKIELYENTLRHISPEAILKRGYSITLANGRVVKDAASVDPNTELRTILADGEIISISK